MLATITSKGQITLPGELRKKLRLKAGDRVDFFLRENGHIEGVPIKQPASKLKGMLPKPKQPVSLARMQDAIIEGACRHDRD